MYKKIWEQYKELFFRQGGNMANPQQNEVQNGTEQFKKDMNLLQDKIKKLKK